MTKSTRASEPVLRRTAQRARVEASTSAADSGADPPAVASSGANPTERADRLASRLPSRGHLQSMLDGMSPDGERQVELLRRERNKYTSTSPSEIVTVRLAGGQRVQLFNKYFFDDIITAGSRSATPFNEVLMYRHVLRPPLTLPRVFGTWIDEAAGEAWLVLEYLSKARRLMHVVEQRQALETASRWMGEFHRSTETRLHEPALGFLRHLDADYFRRCLRRLVESAHGPTNEPLSWLMCIEERFDQAMASLAASRPTVIHAEFYPKNVLVVEGGIYPIDWETASTGFGEIDFAMLLTGWPSVVFDRCLLAYRDARGLTEPESELRRRIAIATVLVDLHWLAHSVGAAETQRPRLSPEDPWLERLRQSAESAGIV